MTEELKQRIEKIYELVNRGATEGERAAARKALDRLMKKHNLSDDVLQDVGLRDYRFTYSTELEINLFIRLWRIMLRQSDTIRQDNWGKRNLIVKLNYADYVLLDCAYEYFRKHMKAQYNKTVLPELRKCRKAKTKSKRRKELSDIFFSRYVIKSNLYDQKEIATVQFKTDKQWEDHRKMQGIEGGDFKKQVAGNNLLTY